MTPKNYYDEVAQQYNKLLEQRNNALKPHENLLPPDLAEQIIENGKKELKALKKRIEDADKKIAEGEAKIKELRKKRRKTIEVIPQYRDHITFDGEIKQIELDPIYRSTQETVEVEKEIRKYQNWKNQWERHKSYLCGLRSDTVRVIEEARKGTASVLLNIVKNWENNTFIVGPVMRIIQEPDPIYTDAAGNPTPDGRPIWEGIPRKPNEARK